MVDQKIKKILVPLDGSKNASRGFESALHLAKEHEASLVVIHVIPTSEKKKGKKSEEIIPSFVITAKRLASKIEIPFDFRVLTGDPGHAIVDYTNTHDIDLIVIGARGLSTFKKIFLGSVTSYVMQKSKVPVMLIK